MQYSLDLETLLIFLGNRKQSGKLSADLKRFPGIAYKGPCRVEISLVGGKVVLCAVQDREGKVVVGGESALRELQRMGQLDWAWVAANQTDTSAPLSQRKPPSVSSLIPRRLVSIEMIDRNRLPRKHWQVLLLVDGSRTVAHIATLLTGSPLSPLLQEVIDILNDLQKQGIIVFTE